MQRNRRGVDGRAAARVGVAIFAAALATAHAAPGAIQEMDGKSISAPQDKPIPLPHVSDAQKERNKQLVLDFFHNVGDVNDWSDENVQKYVAADFINHAKEEPSTEAAYAAFMRKLMQRVGPRPNRAVTGGLPTDSKGRPVQYLFADGDFVVNIRDLDWPLDDGGVYRTYMGDVFRIKSDRIAEAWCVCAPMPKRPGDAKKP